MTDSSGNTVSGTSKTDLKWSTYVVDQDVNTIATQGKNWVGDIIDSTTFNNFEVGKTYNIVFTFKYQSVEKAIKIPVKRNAELYPYPDDIPSVDDISQFLGFHT